MRDIFSDDEVQALVLAVLRAHGEEGATDTQMRVVCDWATQVRLDAAMLSLILGGEVLVRVRDDGEMEFRKVQP